MASLCQRCFVNVHKHDPLFIAVEVGVWMDNRHSGKRIA
jgi:hypothetical protein